jgi:hypothetical protein
MTLAYDLLSNVTTQTALRRLAARRPLMQHEIFEFDTAGFLRAPLRQRWPATGLLL